MNTKQQQPLGNLADDPITETVAHTPGPWRVVEGEFGKMIFKPFLVRAPEFDKAIADCDFQSAEENAANARLIAAAPDLLELARQVVLESEQRNCSIPADIIAGAVAALSKATGAAS